MWLQQGPIIAQELLAKIQATGWVLEKTTNNGDNVLSQKAPRRIFMVTVRTEHKIKKNTRRLPSL